MNRTPICHPLVKTKILLHRKKLLNHQACAKPKRRVARFRSRGVRQMATSTPLRLIRRLRPSPPAGNPEGKARQQLGLAPPSGGQIIWSELTSAARFALLFRKDKVSGLTSRTPEKAQRPDAHAGRLFFYPRCTGFSAYGDNQQR
jgi:hypothetical protein